MSDRSDRFDVSVVGELNLDLILTGLPAVLELEREHLARELHITLGSSSAIFAHNLSSLGSRVGFSSTTGDDAHGALCLERLALAGVDVGKVRRLAGQQTGLTLILPSGGKRYILTYPGTMATMTLDDLDLDYVFRAGHFHLSSYFLQRALRPQIPELFRLAKSAGLTTSLDTNDDPEDLWTEDLLEVLKYVDVLLPNEREACRMARTEDSGVAAERLSERVPLVVVKRGPAGATARRGRESFTSRPISVGVTDTVGAGDSFDAGFLHQYVRGAALDECLRSGNLAGALSTTRSGGTEAFRDAAHREQFLREHSAGLRARDSRQS